MMFLSRSGRTQIETIVLLIIAVILGAAFIFAVVKMGLFQ